MRTGVIVRTRLLDRLLSSAAPVISVVGPAGYGKTTLLAQWADGKRPRLGWVSVDLRDNDPVVLLTYIAMALDRIETIDPRVFRALASSDAGIEGPRQLVAAMAKMPHPVALVIDNLEAVTNPQSLDAIAALALGMPTGSQLAIGSCDVLPVPAGRLRAQGGIVEIGIGDLAMNSHEAAPLLSEAGVEVGDVDLDELVRRTEGWPAGLYLAALAVNAGGSSTAAGAALTGDDRFIEDYLRSEILDRVSPDGGIVPHPHGGPRPDVRSALRRRPRCRPDRAQSSSSWRAATCWWSRSTDAASGTDTTNCSASCSCRSCVEAIRTC